LERRTVWQGLWLIVLGVFFLVLTFILHDIGYVKSDRLILLYVPSAILVAIGAVILVLSQRIPRRTSVKKLRQKA
jgi:lipopolysaccharide export LptBFGC system permease protein LptF